MMIGDVRYVVLVCAVINVSDHIFTVDFAFFVAAYMANKVVYIIMVATARIATAHASFYRVHHVK